jgi:RNA polymerase sigma-70 factor, ECF subfamily
METCRSHDEIRVNLFAAAATDDVLVAAAKLGDRPAFAELWKRHSNLAFTKVYRITRNRADAEDVIQEAWMKAYVHLDTFNGSSAFSTWLTSIAINSAFMTLRRKQNRPEACMEVMDGETWRQREIADQTKDTERHYLRREDVERLRRAIGRLRPSLRNVVEIHQSNDRSVKEIAALAGISISAAKSRLFRAKTVLRKALDVPI